MQISVIKWQMSTNIDLKLKVDFRVTLFILCLCYVFEKQLTTVEILMSSGYTCSKLMASGQQEEFLFYFKKHDNDKFQLLFIMIIFLLILLLVL